MPCMGDDPNCYVECRACGCYSMWHSGVIEDAATRTWKITGPKPGSPHCVWVKGRKKETRITEDGGIIKTFVEGSGTPCDCPGFDPSEEPFFCP